MSTNNHVSSITLEWAALSDKGLVREENEDAWYVNEELRLYIVSDGMGGHRGGSLASKIVIEDLPVFIETGLHKLKSTRSRSILALLKRSVIQQSRHVHLEGTSESGYKDMGATVALIFFHGTRVYVANLGDSRIYRWRNHRLTQLSKDHSVIAELIEEGHLHPDEAGDHEYHGQITHYIGMSDQAEPFTRSFAVKADDRFILCTDGISDLLDEKAISRVLRQNLGLNDICEALIRQANINGGHDNATVLIVECTRQKADYTKFHLMAM